MKLRPSGALISVFVFWCAAFPVFGQQISDVELNDSESAPAWQEWDSIYGIDLQTTDTTVSVDYFYTNGSGIYEKSIAFITASTEYENYWYDSSTQINFLPWANGIGFEGYTILTGCPPAIDNCNYTQVCDSADNVCTNVWEGVYSGTPGTP
jgi:hypothetical protein